MNAVRREKLPYEQLGNIYIKAEVFMSLDDLRN